MFRLREDKDHSVLKLPSLGYARKAIKSYADFCRLQGEGTIPPDVRFQVSLPTAVALASMFVVAEQRGEVEPVIETALKHEVDEIVRNIRQEKLPTAHNIGCRGLRKSILDLCTIQMAYSAPASDRPEVPSRVWYCNRVRIWSP